MAVEVLDTTGLRCPLPVLRVALRAPVMESGDILEVLGDCPTLERDLRTWCGRLAKVLLSVKDEGDNAKRIQIRI